MIKHLTMCASAVFLLAACGGSDPASSFDEPQVDPLVTVAEADTSTADCPYLADADLSAIMALAITETVGGQGGCQWSFEDGTGGTLSRFPASYYAENSGKSTYIGDLDDAIGRWGNSNVLVLIDDEYTLLYNAQLQNPPLRDEVQAIGRALVASN